MAKEKESTVKAACLSISSLVDLLIDFPDLHTFDIPYRISTSLSALQTAWLQYDSSAAEEPQLRHELRLAQIELARQCKVGEDILERACQNLQANLANRRQQNLGEAARNLWRSLPLQFRTVENLIDHLLDEDLTDSPEFYEFIDASAFERKGTRDAEQGVLQKPREDFQTDADYDAYTAGFRRVLDASERSLRLAQLWPLFMNAPLNELDALIKTLSDSAAQKASPST